MGVKFILGRSGCGKTEHMISEIKELLKTEETSPIVILVPDQYTFEMEKRVSLMLDGDTKDKYLRVRSMGITSLSDIISAETGGLAKTGINAAGKSMLIYKAIEKKSSELELFKKAHTQRGFTGSISEMISELKQFKINPDKLEELSAEVENENLSMKLKDIATIYREFENDLHERYIDLHDRIAYMAEHIEECRFLDGAHVYIDGFSSFTPNQYDVLRGIIKKADEVSIILTMDSPFNSGYADFFASSRTTYNRIKDLCSEEGIKIHRDINLNSQGILRFKGNKELEHLEKYYNVYPYKRYREKTESVRVLEVSNLYEEVEKIAQEIASSIRKGEYRYKDIAVATRDIDRYESLIKPIFTEYEIPFYINKKGDAKGNPIITMILSFLEMKRRRYGYEIMFRYLKSGILDFSDYEISMLENYVIANGISGSKWFEETWEYRIPYSNYDMEESEEELEIKREINLIKQRVVRPIEKFENSLKQKSRNTVEDMCRYLYEFMCDIDVFGRVENIINGFKESGKLEEAARYSQVWDTVVDLMDQMVEILGDEKISLERFHRIVNTAFDECSLKTIPASADYVMVTGVDRMKNPYNKHLYLIGTIDGVFPMVSKNTGLLSDSDRNRISTHGVEIDKDSRSRVYEEQFMVYKALTTPSEKLTVSYPISDYDGNTQRPSIIVSRMKKLFKNLSFETNLIKDEGTEEKEITLNTVSKQASFNKMVEVINKASENKFKNGIGEVWEDVYRYYSDNERYSGYMNMISEALDYSNQEDDIKKEKIDNLYKDKTVSISRIEKYAECPFAYFIEYGLRAKERKEFMFAAPDVGSFIHKVVESFSKGMQKDGITWHEVDRVYINIRAEKIIDEMIAKIPGYILESSSKYKYLAERLKRLVMVSIDIIAEQIRCGNFEPEDYEAVFGKRGKYSSIKVKIHDDRTLELIGKIDRIDGCIGEEDKKYIRIVDYKWGDKDINLNEVYYGLQLQLMVYMDAILESENTENNTKLKPAGMLYSRMNNPIIKSNAPLKKEEVDSMFRETFKMKGLIIKNPEVMEYMDRNLANPKQKSSVIRAETNKDGTPSKNTAGITDEQFEIIREYTRKNMGELCTGMMSGNIKIEPKKSNDRDACRFCAYSSICKFDTTLKDNSYKVIYNMSNDDIILKMKEDIK